MSDEQWYDKIEAYLFGELPPEEAEAFTRQIEADPALAEQVAIHRAEHEAMEVLIEREIRENLKGWIQEVKEEAPVVRKLRPLYRQTWFQLAAAAVALFLVGLFVFRPADEGEGTAPLAQDDFRSEQILLPYQEENGSGAGFAGPGESGDSIVVLLQANEQYDRHYRFRDTLEIFYTDARPDLSNWRIVYDAQSDAYQLMIRDSVYSLTRGFNSIYELKTK